MSSFSASMSRIQPAMRARASVNFRQKLSPAVGVVRTLAGRDTRPFPTKYQRENTRSSVCLLIVRRQLSWHSYSNHEDECLTLDLHRCKCFPASSSNKYISLNFYPKVIELAQVAVEFDSETVTTFVAALLGVGAGIGVPIFFVIQVQRAPVVPPIRDTREKSFVFADFLIQTNPNIFRRRETKRDLKRFASWIVLRWRQLASRWVKKRSASSDHPATWIAASLRMMTDAIKRTGPHTRRYKTGRRNGPPHSIQ